MQTANHILQAIGKLGEKRIPMTRVYRSLFSEDLFLTAYSKIYRNQGALTPGTENDTVDGMSLERIQNLIEDLRCERFRFRPVRRIQIPKGKGGSRPLGIPNFTDKLVQEVLRMILEAYYEPRFRGNSHGFRPERGCHTALEQLKGEFKGTVWFIEGDIRGCFDNIDHEVLMGILSKDIQDGRLLNLIRMSLEAGIMEGWKYRPSYSGTPQGGILSPLLANVYLHELDCYIEDVLIPQNTKGQKRAANRAYERLGCRAYRARRRGDMAIAQTYDKQMRQLPSQDTQDPGYRRLKYVRYADDFLLGFIGSKSEAQAIKEALGAFLREKLHLELSKEKTLITHARTEHARFLGYTVSSYVADSKLSRRAGTSTKTRSINGGIRLGIPYGLVTELAGKYERRGKPVHVAPLLGYSDAHIIDYFQQRFRGVAEYYKYAVDRCHLAKLKYAMETALVKTLAYKFKTSVSQVYRKYRGTRTVDGQSYKTLQVEVPTSQGSRLIYWGAIPLKVVKPGAEPIQDTRYRDQYTEKRSDLIQRLQADTCELCGSQDRCQVHHVRRLSDLKKRWAGRKGKPPWVRRMIALRRKTLVVCFKCHRNIHAGSATPNLSE
jgi:group II intron reverse transcriptase/maturase